MWLYPISYCYTSINISSLVGWFLVLHCLTITSLVLFLNYNWLVYFVTHFLFRHYFGKVCHPVIHGISVGLDDFKLFTLLPCQRSPQSCDHSDIYEQSRELCEWQKWRQILPLLISYPEWKVPLYAVNAWHGTPSFTSFPKFLSPLIMHQPWDHRQAGYR
jgi:hypothetical protein